MVTDARIEEALKWGEKNKQAMELVRNWCAHVSFERFGGVGLVEQMSGLPIGHFALQCPHASGERSYGPDMARTALSFYDTHCVGCKFRQPVGFPNLSVLVAERDERRKQRKLEEEREAKDTADKAAARENARSLIRAKLEPMAAMTLDLISELDRCRSKEAGEKLVQTAGLAPETFTPKIVEYLFAQIEAREAWLVGPALGALVRLAVDKARLSDAALRNFYAAQGVAAEIIEKYGEFADEALIPPALPGLITMASPEPYPFMHEITEPVEGPLRELYRKRPASVRSGLKVVLARTEAHNARLAARGIRFLSEQDPTLVGFGTDELLAKLARAKWLTQGREEEVSNALRDIRQTLVGAFDADPHAVDSLVNDYLLGASEEGIAELYKLYQDVVHRARRLDKMDEEVMPTEATRLAFRRLVVAASEKDDEDRADFTSGVFSGDPYELTPLVTEEIDLLLGSAANIAVRLGELAKKPLNPKDPTVGWARTGLRTRLNGLMDAYVRWACIAAGRSGVGAVEKVLATMRGLPESSSTLRAAIVGNFHRLAATTEGLMQVLPDYYSALVGSSVIVRSDAATTLGEMPRIALKNMPSLVFEAFTALLADPYVMVHKAATRALERFSLPDEYRSDVIRALSGWILSYAKARNDDRFLVQMLELYAQRYVSDENIAGSLGDRLLEIVMTVTPETVLYESRTAMPVFAKNANYVRFFLRLLEDEKAMAIFHEDLLDQFQRRPPASLYQERARTVEVGVKASQRYPWAVAVFIEALTACGAWTEAATLAATVYNGIADTKQHRTWRLHMSLYKIACDYEAAIADGRDGDLGVLGNQWRRTLEDIRKDHEENERKRSPLSGLFGED